MVLKTNRENLHAPCLDLTNPILQNELCMCVKLCMFYNRVLASFKICQNSNVRSSYEGEWGLQVRSACCSVAVPRYVVFIGHEHANGQKKNQM